VADHDPPTTQSNSSPAEDETLPTSKKTVAPADETIDAGSSSDPKPEIRMKSVNDFGDYEVIEEIARGGMGVVYKARHRTLNRVVAVKMILSGQFASEDDVRRFHQEAESAANLDHSGIVPIYDIGEHEGRHFFSMKYIEGGSLAKKLPELRKDTRKIVRLIAEVARAIHHAHQRGILHRDLKPANILLDEHDKPLVSDLGLAKQIKSESDLTHTGAVVGTPAYMPPEQAAAKKEITTAADIYSIGAILYEALTGRPPHKADSPVETMMRVLDADIVRPRELDRGVDTILELICLKCLEKDPDRRYSSSAALAEDLENWADGNPVSVRPPSIGSALTLALVANARSVLGAGIVGILAGLLFAFCLSRMHHDGSIVENPPTEIYEKLPTTIPLGRSLVFLEETHTGGPSVLFATLGTLATLTFTGIIVALLTRPKPGSEALAMALITSILMSIALFTSYTSLGGMGDAQVPARKAVMLLTLAALGEEPQSESAKELLFKSYPGLEKLPAEDQAVTLGFRVFYDGLFKVPTQLLLSMGISLLICILPVMLGTTFGSKLVHKRTAISRILPVYVEFMLLTSVLGFLVFLQTVIPYIDPEAGVPQLGLVKHFGRQIFVYSFMGLMALAIYRQRLAWKGRLLGYVAFVAICAIAF
jgi:eukaryotic-like serine/threonine-protein kinase